MHFNGTSMVLKIVYWGPGRSGKTTNLEIAHRDAPRDAVGDLEVTTTEGDRTIFYDTLPVRMGTISGVDVRFQFYTVPGQAKYSQTRRMVLSMVDGVVFVADSSPDKMEENRASLEDLFVQLRNQHLQPETLPVVIQYNKRDHPEALPFAQMQEELNPLSWPAVTSIAIDGNGVSQTMETICEITLRSASGALRHAERSQEQATPRRSATRILRRGDVIRRSSDHGDATPPPQRKHSHLADAAPAEGVGSDRDRGVSDKYLSRLPDGGAEVTPHGPVKADEPARGAGQSSLSDDVGHETPQPGSSSKTRRRLAAINVRGKARDAARVTKLAASEMAEEIQQMSRKTAQTVCILPRLALIVIGSVAALLFAFIILIFFL